jgi:hypothetical protein
MLHWRQNMKGAEAPRLGPMICFGYESIDSPMNERQRTKRRPLTLISPSRFPSTGVSTVNITARNPSSSAFLTFRSDATWSLVRYS